MTMAMPGGGGGTPTIREVYQLVDAVKKEIIAQLEKLAAELHTEINQLSTELNARLETHKIEHERDRDRISSKIRWAVTTVIAVLGVVVAAYAVSKGA